MDPVLDVHTPSRAQAVIVPKGRMDAVTARVLKLRIGELIAEGRSQIVCELGEVTSVDSSGLSALVSGLKLARENGGFFRVAGVNEQVSDIFKLTMLDRVFELHPTVEAALE